MRDSRAPSWTPAALVGWANEPFLITRLQSGQYCFRTGNKCIYGPGNETFTDGETKRVVTVDAAYIGMHAPLVKARLKHAGVRPAHLLNSNLGR